MFAPRLIEVTSAWEQVVSAREGPVQLVNRSITQTVLLGLEGSDTGGNSVAILDPLGSQVLDGKRDVWASTITGTAFVNKIPGGQYSQVSPELIAQQIFSTTVPLGRKPANVGFNAAGIPAGGSATLFTNAMITQPSYQFYIFLQANMVGMTMPFVRVHLKWGDADSSFSADIDRLIVPVGFPSFNDLFVTGPAREDLLTITLDNLDPAIALGYTYTFTQTSQTYEQMRATQVDINGMPVFSKGGQIPEFGMIFNTAAVLSPGSPGTPVQRIANVWSGDATMCVDNHGQPNAVRVRLLDPGIAAGGTAVYVTNTNGILRGTDVAAGGTETARVSLPNGPVVVEALNEGAASTIAPAITLIRIDK